MIFTENVEVHLKEVCQAISERYEIDFLEIGVDKNHVHFLIQSVPKYSPTKIAQTVHFLTVPSFAYVELLPMTSPLYKFVISLLTS